MGPARAAASAEMGPIIPGSFSLGYALFLVRPKIIWLIRIYLSIHFSHVEWFRFTMGAHTISAAPPQSSNYISLRTMTSGWLVPLVLESFENLVVCFTDYPIVRYMAAPAPPRSLRADLAIATPVAPRRWNAALVRG